MKWKKALGKSSVWLTALIFLSGSGLWRCAAEEENYFQEETLTETITLGQMEAYDALEVDYLVETQMHNTKTYLIYSAPLGYRFFNDSANKTLTLEFGTDTLAVTFFNRVRSGTITVKYSTTLADSMATRIVTFDHFRVNEKMLSGEIDIDSVGGDTIQIHSHCTFKNFGVTFPDGSGATYNGRQNRLWASGENDFNPANNSYVITNLSSSLQGTTLDKRPFTCTLTRPVTLNYYCALSGNYAGVIGTVTVPELTGFAARTREVIFGTICDNQVTVTTWRRSFPLKVN